MVIILLTERQLQLLAHLLPFESLTFSEWKEKAKEKSNNLLQQSIAKFKKEGIILSHRRANLILYELNLENFQLHHYLGLITSNWLETLPKIDQKEIRRIRDALLSQSPFSSIVLFGSFAEGKQRKESDIDVALIVEKEGIVEIGSVKDRNFREIDFHIITRKDFQEMLANEEFNLGKEIKRKHRVLHNPTTFYELLLTARNPPTRLA